MQKAADAPDLADDDVGDPALEGLGFGFAGSENQLIETGLGDEDRITSLSDPIGPEFTNSKVSFFHHHPRPPTVGGGAS